MQYKNLSSNETHSFVVAFSSLIDSARGSRSQEWRRRRGAFPCGCVVWLFLWSLTDAPMLSFVGSRLEYARKALYLW